MYGSDSLAKIKDWLLGDSEMDQVGPEAVELRRQRNLLGQRKFLGA